MSAVTQHQIDMMRTRLGARRSHWAPQGVEFLRKRSNGNVALFECLFSQYLSGGFDTLDDATEQEVRILCGLDRLCPEAILILLLGRRPRWGRRGIQEHKHSLSPTEVERQVLLAEALTGGRRYLTKRKAAATSMPQVREPRPVGAVGSRAPKTAAPVTESATSVGTDGRSRCVESRSRLIAVLRNRPDYMNKRLSELKGEAWRFNRSDFLWHALLQSFSTLLNSRGYAGLIQNAANYAQATYEALAALDPSQRLRRLDSVLQRAKVRMASKKAGWLAKNFDLIAAMGGPDAAKQLAVAQQGTEGKMRFVRQFAGIDKKYGRNIWMDVYHPEFRESIAVDDRINKLSQAMGCEFSSFEDHERFYLKVAQEVGLEGWELDRLIYNYRDYFLEMV